MLKLLQMKNIIKKGLILFSFNLLLPIPGLSQITLDSIQSKTLCLILNEHEKLSIENPLLKQQINSLEELNKFYVESDSIRTIQADLFKDKIASDERVIKKQKKLIIGSSVGGILLFILGLIL